MPAARERRFVTATSLEIRATSDGVTIEGYASTFGQPYDMGWYTERVQDGAFTKTLQESPDVRFLVNHDGLPLARTASGTLDLSQDSTGLHMRSTCDPADPDVQRIVPKVKRGDLDQMSFGFRTIRDLWSDDYSERSLIELSLAGGDVSIVTYPANPNTSVGVRMAQLAIDDPERVRALYRQIAEQRAGKKISAATAGTLQSALEQLRASAGSNDEAMTHLNSLLEDADGNPDPDGQQENAGPAAAEQATGLHPSVLRVRADLALIRRTY